MSHMVIFRSNEGKAGYHQAEALDDAVRFVERLRNAEGVEHARIFSMEEVSFEFRPYYRVEVPSLAAAGATPAPQAPEEAQPEPIPDPQAAVPPAPEEQPEPSPGPIEHGTIQPYTVEEYVSGGNGGRRGLFGR